jgi:transglutaminase-like putative cysteine protease
MFKKYFLTYLLLILSLIIFVSCGPDTPVITSIDPKIGRMGEVITLTGSNFGALRNDSYVTIAGISPTNSSYFLWQDDLIMVRVPELGESGLVFVHTRGKKSNGVLFSNSANVPRPADGEELGLRPRIISISPQSGVPGSIITITGNNFGISRESSLQTMSFQAASQSTHGVFFSWDYELSSNNPFIVREPEFIEAAEIEAGYESWSSREIRVRVPDGAVSGNLEIRTPHGSSLPVFFEIAEKPGTKTFKNRRSYTITYSVDIRVTQATRPNTLYLWIPKPVISPSQRSVTLLSRNVEPFTESHRGVSLFKLDNLTTGSNQSINLSFRVDVYTVETAIRPQAIRQERSPIYTMYTQNTALIPRDNQQIRTIVNSIIGREQNPYLKARAIYDWIIRNIRITNTPYSEISLLTALEQRRADPYIAALLFTTMVRAAGVPCIPIAGVLIDGNGLTNRHYWAEFWIDGFGWLPVDPAMGAGAITLAEGTVVADPASYYFGNMDNQRIAFSRGEINLAQMESRGRIVSQKQSYSLQNIWEEAAGGLESYTSLWRDIVISGFYAQ